MLRARLILMTCRRTPYLILFVSIMDSVTIMGVCGGAARISLTASTHLLHPGLAIGVNLATDRVGGADRQVFIFVLQDKKMVSVGGM